MMNSLKLRASNDVLLVGAGISVSPPFGIPPAAAIVEALAAWLGDGDRTQTGRARRALAARGNNPYAMVRFEQVWQTLDSLMPGIARTQQALELFGAPNENHGALAEILANGGTVITTNFDRMIEKALKRRGARCRPWVFGPSAGPPDAQTRYFKIHGSFGRRGRLLTTLFSIGAAGLAFDRLPHLKEALASRVDGRTVIVAGYSFSDHFDVVPLIENEWRPSRLIWMDYQPGAPGLVSPLDAIEETVLPEARLPFPVGALARVRARLQKVPVIAVQHDTVWRMLKDLGLCAGPIEAGQGLAKDVSVLNRAAFEDALEDARWTVAQKRMAIQMLEKQDGFGFHASLDTEHDNDWTVLEAAPNTRAQPPDPGATLFDRVAQLVRNKQVSTAQSLLDAEAGKRGLRSSKAVLLARALCAREQGDLRQGWRLQLQYVDERNTGPTFWCAHRHTLESAELYASLALDYLDHARLLGHHDLAVELIRGLRRLFETSGLIWVGAETALAEARQARSRFQSAASPEFSRSAALAEKAAYYAWRSGRWDLAKRAVNELTWYLTMTGKARHSLLLLDRLRAVCPEDDPSGWVALTANIALNAALYVDPARARQEISSMETRIDRAQPDLWLHVLVCDAACTLAEGKPRKGRKALQRAQEALAARDTDAWGHQACIDAIRRRFRISNQDGDRTSPVPARRIRITGAVSKRAIRGDT
jgi:hypothetical protein